MLDLYIKSHHYDMGYFTSDQPDNYWIYLLTVSTKLQGNDAGNVETLP